jgi:hypothetical protein
MRLDRSFHKYMRVAHEVDGWLSNTTALVSHSLIRFQSEINIKGNICEIGIHHGRYFIALLTSTTPDERGIAIDLFENQSENIDNSGCGDSRAFLEYVERFSQTDKVIIIKDNSLRVTPESLLVDGRGIRFFSIDGGHTSRITTSDLFLAEKTILPEGIVALDDILNPFWTGVISGYAEYKKTGGRLTPFALVPNKLLLCNAEHIPLYRAHLRAQFSHCVGVSAEFFDDEIDLIEESNPDLFHPT